MMQRDVVLGDLITPAKIRRAGGKQLPILSMTMHGGLVDQSAKFKKRVASLDTSTYKVVTRGQLVVGFPIDEGVLSFQEKHHEAIVSPAYDIWDVVDPERIDRSYLGRFLRCPRALSYYRGKLRGTTARRRSLPKDTFLELPVLLPKLGEQKRITQVLDHADALRAKRHEAIALLDDLARSVFLDMFGDPRVNPMGWPVRNLGSIGDVQGGLQLSGKREQMPVSIPYLRVANIYRNRLALDEVKKLRATHSEIERTLLKAGDLLVVEGHGNPEEIGRAAIWDGSIEPCTHQNHLIRVRLNREEALPAFIGHYINSPGGARHLLDSARTTSGLNTISVSIVKAAPVALPNVGLQRRFASRIADIERLKSRHEAHLTELESLFASVQYRAFRGELWADGLAA
jgi:Restriction endonuclease S subunits